MGNQLSPWARPAEKSPYVRGHAVTGRPNFTVDKEGGQGTQDLYAEHHTRLTPLGPLSTATEKHNGGSGTALGLWIKNHCVIMRVPERSACVAACVYVSVWSELKLLTFIMFCIIPCMCAWDDTSKCFLIIVEQ